MRAKPCMHWSFHSVSLLWAERIQVVLSIPNAMMRAIHLFPAASPLNWSLALTLNFNQLCKSKDNLYLNARHLAVLYRIF